jgi:hypothetical protein
MGFEPAQARRDYLHTPDRNPKLQLDMPTEVPPDRETCVMWDKEADSHNGKLESEYYTALQAHLEVLNTTIATVVPPAATTLKRKKYTRSRRALRRAQKGALLPENYSAQRGERLVGSGGCEAGSEVGASGRPSRSCLCVCRSAVKRGVRK